MRTLSNHSLQDHHFPTHNHSALQQTSFEVCSSSTQACTFSQSAVVGMSYSLNTQPYSGRSQRRGIFVSLEERHLPTSPSAARLQPPKRLSSVTWCHGQKAGGRTHLEISRPSGPTRYCTIQPHATLLLDSSTSTVVIHSSVSTLDPSNTDRRERHTPK